jgi:hypothetical protein
LKLDAPLLGSRDFDPRHTASAQLEIGDRVLWREHGEDAWWMARVFEISDEKTIGPIARDPRCPAAVGAWPGTDTGLGQRPRFSCFESKSPYATRTVGT